MNKIILSADSTCDLGDVLKERYEVNIHPLHINLNDKLYNDGIDITPDNIYDTYQKHLILPKTSAPNPIEYMDYFKKWTDDGYQVIHLNIGSGISSAYQNCCIAAKELGNVYPIDSGNLSTGMGLLVIEAAERIAQGMVANQICQEVNKLKTKVHASFIVDNLTYLREGGRCSAVAALGANLFNIKPSIEVDNSSGKMKVGRKYRGTLPRVLKHYTLDKLSNKTDLKDDRIFISHSGTSSENINLIRETIEEISDFKEILVTRAGCTISSHCGPNTVGILYMSK
ncbi:MULTISPECIES: DegV family protein [unclassified Sedimentibacter]|uniref:DegV family protein n=1 Tax=unclassified Sedimentibacter TaxID=2649220 RepID=UPI0027DFF6BE|nr:DegV family protein [Sedimentibacter sp. MB35-C1]WMJ77513.1 DegV family protein [Sedimentibacter sp. MB35-C1]